MAFSSTADFALFSPHTPISFTVMSMVSLRDILSLGAVSRGGYSACQEYLTTAWSFHRFFRKWFDDTKGLRNVLRLTGAVISGSQALQFFERTQYPNSDLDIFLQSNKLQILVQWLLQSGYEFSSQRNYGFTLTPTGDIIPNARNIPPYPGEGEFNVYNFTRNTLSSSPSCSTCSENNEEQLVQLIVTNGDPMEHILTHFHSSTCSYFFLDFQSMLIFPQRQ